MINYRQGDATAPRSDGIRIIAHICNDLGAWGKGFVVALSRRYPQSREAYLKWKRSDAGAPFALGNLQLVKVDEGLFVANMIAQHGLRSRDNPVPLRLDALETCLAKLGERCLQAKGPVSVHMPRIGTGLAGGQWRDIEAVIERTLVKRGVPVVVYDLPAPHPAFRP